LVGGLSLPAVPASPSACGAGVAVGLIGVVLVVGVVVLVVEGAAHGLDGRLLEAQADVGVDVGCGVELGVAEEFFDTTSSTPCSRSSVAHECLRS
jgi:hypothetical protein